MSFFNELKQRSVIRVAAAYLVIGWLLAQIATTLEDALNLPAWFDTLVVTLLMIGFPIALLFSWAFELTPDGIKKESEIEAVTVELPPEPDQQTINTFLDEVEEAEGYAQLDDDDNLIVMEKPPTNSNNPEPKPPSKRKQ